MKVAIVDDCETTLAWVESVLGEHGIDVRTLNTALGVRAFLHDVGADLVLLDVNMPALSGSTLCKMIKQNKLTSRVVVLLHSSNPEAELARLTQECGADGYIPKTRDGQELVRRLRSFAPGQRALSPA